MMRFEYYLTGFTGLWFWRLRAANGRIIADGAEGYETSANCRRAIGRLNRLFVEQLPVRQVQH